MSSSDFHATVALVHAGKCAMCEGVLEEAYCATCDVGWAIYGVHERAPDGATIFGMGPFLGSSRRLESEEIKRIYARGVSPDA